MQEPMLLRLRARDNVRQLLKTMIREGQFLDGGRLDEVRLSERIGVSRTPLREAFIELEGEGILRSAPNKGFSLVRVNADMVREIYPILGALEVAALRLGGRKVSALASKLRAMNERLARETSKLKQHRLDSEFHALLTQQCDNARLLHLLETHRIQAQRIDGAHDRGLADRHGSCAEHAEIVGALESNEIEMAARTLEAHWRRGQEVVISWLERRG